MEPTQPPSPPAVPPSPTGEPKNNQWLVALHASALVGMILPAGNIIGPLIVWLMKKAEMPEIETAGRTVLNFQISWTIWFIVSIIVAAVGSCLIIPIAIPFVLWIAWIVFVILGAVKASNGESYVFPLTIKFL